MRYEVELINLEAKSPLIWTIGSFLIAVIVTACEYIQAGAFVSLQENPMYGPGDETMLQMGGKYGPLIAAGEWWRFGTAVYLQNGLISLALTGLALYFCRIVERDSGFQRASLLFILSGWYGYSLSALVMPQILTCGMTGAVFGYLGLMFSDLLSSCRSAKRNLLQLLLQCILTVVLTLAGLTPYVDQWAHIGGGVIGFLFALMLLPNMNFGKCERICHGAISFLAFPILAAIFMLTMTIFFRKVDVARNWCPGCSKINAICLYKWCEPLSV
jgi:membrane associated rhomboid family serine protease